MKRLKKFLFLLLLLPICVNAQVAMNDSSVEEVDGSNVVAGNNVTSTNKVNGINIVFGNNVNLNGENDYAVLFGNNVNISGNVNNDGFIFGNIINFTKKENNIIANPKFPTILYRKFKIYPNKFAKKDIISYLHFKLYFLF